MLKKLGKIEMPSWLSNSDFNFEVNKVLDNSLYYPACYLDGDPVKFFMGNVYSFFYVDIRCRREDFIEEIQSRGFKGYYVIHHQRLKPENFGSSLCNRKYYRNYEDSLYHYYSHRYENFWCDWLIFERKPEWNESHNPKRFSLLYMQAEGLTAYYDVYITNNIKPRIITFIQTTCDWMFRNSMFAKILFSKKFLLPEYLVFGGMIYLEEYLKLKWEEYNIIVWCFDSLERSLVLWKRNDKNIF
ncbi:MAG: hypothetical protein ACP5Q5_09115 [Brevinematia bacterium]